MKPMRPELANEIMAKFKHEASSKAEIAERQGKPYVIVKTYHENNHTVTISSTKWAAAAKSFSQPDTVKGWEDAKRRKAQLQVPCYICVVQFDGTVAFFIIS